MVERPHSIRGGPGSIPGRCSSIFGIWREVLGRNVYIMSQYFFPAIIYRDIISHITITYRYIMYFFRTFKKSTAPYKVHNMGLRYIKAILSSGAAARFQHGNKHSGQKLHFSMHITHVSTLHFLCTGALLYVHYSFLLISNFVI